MSLLIDKIEEFFGTSFQDKEESLWILTHFDGSCHWSIFYMHRQQLLKLTADQQIAAGAYPTVEIEGFFSENVRITPLTDGGEALILQSNDAQNPSAGLWIAKTKTGKLSMATTVGKLPDTIG